MTVAYGYIYEQLCVGFHMFWLIFLLELKMCRLLDREERLGKSQKTRGIVTWELLLFWNFFCKNNLLSKVVLTSITWHKVVCSLCTQNIGYDICWHQILCTRDPETNSYYVQQHILGYMFWKLKFQLVYCSFTRTCNWLPHINITKWCAMVMLYGQFRGVLCNKTDTQNYAHPTLI